MPLEESPHLLLGRIRFINRASSHLKLESKTTKPLPHKESKGFRNSASSVSVTVSLSRSGLCYVPKEVCYKICKDSSSGASACSGPSSGISSVGRTIVSVFDSPHQTPQSKKLSKYHIELKKGTCIRTSGEEYCNSQGLWVKMNKEQLDELKPGQDLSEGWILVCKHTEGGDRLVPVESAVSLRQHQQLLGSDSKPCHRWEQVVDMENALFLGNKPKVAECDQTAVQRLRFVPPTWTYECDEDLVHYFYEHIGKEDENLGSVKQCVTSIEVSSCSEEPSG
ncbi:hypothetical protein WMY93_000708 [Mugilogobius chulae]|uniref:Uncharacterized protein n=1 Tax=Mugilogobius chulae TaxID=88201 RepID=A0AAW0QAT4_9GOBI